jgi:hypothetical protein
MDVSVNEAQRLLTVLRWHVENQAFLAINLGDATGPVVLPRAGQCWVLALSSADAVWAGPGHPLPQTLDSSGAAQLDLPGKTLALYISQEAAH